MIEDIEITNFRCFDRIKFIHDYLIKVFPEAALLDRVNVITLSDRYRDMKISQRAATLADIEWLEPFYESIMRPYYVELNCKWDRHKFRAHFDPNIINDNFREFSYFQVRRSMLLERSRSRPHNFLIFISHNLGFCSPHITYSHSLFPIATEPVENS